MGADGWVVRLDVSPGGGVRVAVKDAIDIAGLPTRVGSPAVARTARPAARDAACVTAVQGAGGVVVGKTALTELCCFANGLNEHEPTPLNPLDPTRVPGGSSSGSAVVVARGEADVAIGTDTGGSVRIPAACCGVAGLKTTWGRISLDGVWPLSPSFDTVGPIARDVAGLELGMRLLDPTYVTAPPFVGPPGDRVVARVRPPVEVDPAVDAAVDVALAATGWRVVETDVPWYAEACRVLQVVHLAESARGNAHLRSPHGLLSERAMLKIETGLAITDDELLEARAATASVRAALVDTLDAVGALALALPTLAFVTPPIERCDGMTRLTGFVNATGAPALALPVPLSGSALPTSLQLVGRPHDEALLLALGADVERAAG